MVERTRKRPKRTKGDPTKGDALAQRYRNRAAMRRVWEAAHNCGTYWTPRNMDEW
jgi:hypothetical protein